MLIYARVQIKTFIEGLFGLNNQYDKFKLSVRDFLIQLKEFSGDNAELYADDKAAELEAAKAAERERASKVGGLLKPAEIADDDELWLDEELRLDHGRNVDETEKHEPSASVSVLDGWYMYGL